MNERMIESINQSTQEGTRSRRELNILPRAGGQCNLYETNQSIWAGAVRPGTPAYGIACSKRNKCAHENVQFHMKIRIGKLQK